MCPKFLRENLILYQIVYLSSAYAGIGGGGGGMTLLFKTAPSNPNKIKINQNITH